MDLVYTVGLHLLTLQLTAAHVLPPTEVTLHCHNFNNTLEWTYKQPSPGLRFRVDISSTQNSFDSKRAPLWVDPPALQADLSFLSDPSDDYLLTVTAVIGQNESKSVPFEGIIFSYFQNSQADKICSVDLPPVNVTAVSDEKVMLRFTHPWLLYKHTISKSKSPKKKRHDTQNLDDLPVFNYNVEIINQTQDSHHDHSCVESVCEVNFSVDAEQKKHCLKITGELKKVHVQGTQEYCAKPFRSPFDEYLEILYIGISLLVLVAFAVILFMVYRKKTASSTPLPSSMTITKQVKQWTMKNVGEQAILPVVEPTSPSPLLPEKEVNDSTPDDTPFTKYDFRMPIGVSIENECEEVCDVTEVEQQKDEYMQGTNLDEEEFIHSSYEKRQVVDVELAPGEQAEGYRG